MNLETALVHELCPICCAKTNEQIVLNKQLTKKVAEQVKEMHGKAIGYSEPCKKCQGYIDKGYVAIIGIDPDKSYIDGSRLVKFNNIYRTGGLVWFKKEEAKKCFNWDRPEPFILAEDEVLDLLKQKKEEFDANEST